jgi:hypothetical protein
MPFSTTQSTEILSEMPATMRNDHIMTKVVKVNLSHCLLYLDIDDWRWLKGCFLARRVVLKLETSGCVSPALVERTGYVFCLDNRGFG